MSQSKTSLLTPIYIKPRADTAWPEDSVFYMLTGSGLFLCRNNPFYQSAVPAPRWPVELAKQKSFLAVRYPKISRRLLEYIVGYFDAVADRHNSEAAVLLAFNRTTQRVQLVVPDQVATVSRNGWGAAYPVGVEYEIPANLSPELTLIGDVHSHVDSAAYASYIDKHDETYRPGLHVVVGRLNCEPPEFHIEAVTDGTRFTVDQELVLGGYRQRRVDIPEAWMDKITIETWGQRYRAKNDYYDERKPETQLDGDKHKSGYHCQPDAHAAARADGNGQSDKHQQPVYETGYDPGDDDDIHQEILENLERQQADVSLQSADSPEAGWELKTDEVPKLEYEKPAATGPAVQKKSKAKPKSYANQEAERKVGRYETP